MGTAHEPALPDPAASSGAAPHATAGPSKAAPLKKGPAKRKPRQTLEQLSAALTGGKKMTTLEKVPSFLISLLQ
jgi:hypothetical protein